MNKTGHLGNDGGAHHILPGWGTHPIEEAPAPPITDHSEGPARAKALVGTDNFGREVWYDPDFPADRLPNAHMAVTGESGSGKTQVMKNVMADLRAQGIPALVLDFKDDYADPVYAQEQGFRVYDPTKQPLPINPLAPAVDRESGTVNPTFHSYQLGEIVSRIYGMGDLQSYRLREAIKGVYQDAGLPTSPFSPEQGQEWPTFQSVKDKLATSKDNSEMIGRMSPIFDFGLFAGSDPAGLQGIVNQNTVIRLGQLPGNEVKNSVAEFFLMGLYNYLISQPQAARLTRLLILDEAWRLVNSPFLEPLMRESRAFGLGVFVATQFPTDLPLTVAGNTGTKMFFGQSDPGEVTQIVSIVTGKASAEGERLATAVRGLRPLHCVFANKQYQPYVTAAANAYFAREKEEPMRELPKPTGGANFNMSKGRTAQSQGTPEYICPHCQSPVDEPGKVCANCMSMIDVLPNVDSGESVAERIETTKRVSEIIPFPPGESEEDGDPFAPFSMSEWQMVKGPKHRSHVVDKLLSETKPCSECGGTGIQDEENQDLCWWCKGDGRMVALPEPPKASLKCQSPRHNYPDEFGVKYCEGCDKAICEDCWDDDVCPDGPDKGCYGCLGTGNIQWAGIPANTRCSCTHHWVDPTP